MTACSSRSALGEEKGLFSSFLFFLKVAHVFVCVKTQTSLQHSHIFKLAGGCR